MGFVIFLLLIVVLGAAGYATAIFMTKKQTKVIEELTEKKDMLMAVNCGHVLYFGKLELNRSNKENVRNMASNMANNHTIPIP